MANPTLYKGDYHCDRFIELCKAGLTIAQIQADFNISKQTYYDWKDRNPEFKAAVEIGVVHAQACAERTLDDISQGRIENANATAQIFKMKAQFKDDYQDTRYIKTDSTVNVYHNLPDDKLNQLIHAKMGLLTQEEKAQLLPHMQALDGEFTEVSAHEEEDAEQQS